MDKHRISRRRLLLSSAATFALLSLPGWKASSVGPVDGDVLPGLLTPDGLDEYLENLRFTKVVNEVAAGASARSWKLSPPGSSERGSVAYSIDRYGRIVRLEAMAAGFSVRALLEDLAAIPFSNSGAENARQWVRELCRRGFERWPGETVAVQALNGVRYEVTAFFNSNGYKAVLTLEPA